MRHLQETWRFTANLQDLQETIRASLVAQTVKNLPAMQDIQVRSLGQEDSPRERNGNPLQYSCLGNPMDRGHCPWQRVRLDWATLTFTRNLKVPAMWVYSQGQIIALSHANQHATTQAMVCSRWCGSGPSSVAPGPSRRKHSAASRGGLTDCGHIILQFLFNQNHSSYVLFFLPM